MSHRFQVTLEIGKPTRIRRPDEPDSIKVFSGKWEERPFYLPTDEGLKEYRVQVEDTPDGVHKHQKEQARAFGNEPPPHPLTPTLEETEYWRVPYRVDGGDIRHAEAECDVWDRRELFVAVQEDLIEALLEKYGEYYQIVVSILKEGR